MSPFTNNPTRRIGKPCAESSQKFRELDFFQFPPLTLRLAHWLGSLHATKAARVQTQLQANIFHLSAINT